MGKKKKKKNSNAVLTIDTANLDANYQSTLMDIQASRYDIEKLIKKTMKEHKKKYGYACSYESARRQVMSAIEGRNPIERIVRNLSGATPQLVILTQLAGIGIETVLSIPAVQRRINDPLLQVATKAYTSCTATGVKKKKKKK